MLYWHKLNASCLLHILCGLKCVWLVACFALVPTYFIYFYVSRSWLPFSISTVLLLLIDNVLHLFEDNTKC